MGDLSKAKPLDALGNHIYLEKQDKLRDIGVDIHTSQIVVVGGQSSGKSSLLENLTGFSFPRGQGLCTRYATQITLRRSPTDAIMISITPSNNASPEERQGLRAFCRELDDFEPKSLSAVMQDANKAMGVRGPGDSKEGMSLPVFSDHILKVEISGPDKPHLTVIDVPGLFQVTDEGTTTASDKAMVENMVRRYMENERTIVLAVMSCLADRATEGIMQFAKAADPNGERTVGVLTKADLVKEKAVYQTILDLVKGNTLKLGYFVVRSRGADEDDLDISDCRQKEMELFGDRSWGEIAKLGRTGVQALETELQVLITDLAKRELPKQRTEVATRLKEALEKQRLMGPARSDSASQREYLVKLAVRFERISRDAVEGFYRDEDDIFYKDHKLRLITRIIDLNEGFAELLAAVGHMSYFVGECDEENDETNLYQENVHDAFVAGSKLPELNIDLIKLECPEPLDDDIMDRIESCYRETRGPELGTFTGSLLARTFRMQSDKWAHVSLCHVKAVIVMIHEFIQGVLRIICVDERVCVELWDALLDDGIRHAYGEAIAHAKFQIDVERDIRPSTFNHYFSDNLQQARLDRITKKLKGMTKGSSDGTYGNLKLNSWKGLVDHRSNVEQTKEEVHDILKSYYKVARKRFADNICRQVIDHHLLYASTGPLRVLSPEAVMAMADSQLERIAGEDALTKRERERLKAKISGLEEAMVVLKS